MESRRLFYRLERRVRGIDSKAGHRHSPLVRNLYNSYLENEIVRDILGVAVVSKASMISHGAVEIEKEQDSVLKMLHARRACVPYLTEGSTLEDEQEVQRQQLVDQYHAYVRAQFASEEEYQEYIRNQRHGNSA